LRHCITLAGECEILFDFIEHQERRLVTVEVIVVINKQHVDTFKRANRGDAAENAERFNQLN